MCSAEILPQIATTKSSNKQNRNKKSEIFFCTQSHTFNSRNSQLGTAHKIMAHANANNMQILRMHHTMRRAYYQARLSVLCLWSNFEWSASDTIVVSWMWVERRDQIFSTMYAISTEGKTVNKNSFMTHMVGYNNPNSVRKTNSTRTSCVRFAQKGTRASKKGQQLEANEFLTRHEPDE